MTTQLIERLPQLAHTISFTEPLTAVVVELPRTPITADDVRIRTLFSGISAGTELTAYRGSNPYLSKRWDERDRLFIEGDVSFEYPMTAWGYEEVGVVTEVGTDAEGVAVGDRIWGAWGHTSETVMPWRDAAKRILPLEVNPLIGIFSKIGGIALNAVIDADIHVGETVAVFGLGVPGQIVAQLARLNGARVIVIDGIEARRKLATRLGAEIALDPSDGDVAARIRKITNSLGADVAIEITGNYSALHEAIRSVAYSSRVVAAGFMQGEGIGLRLGEEFHHNRVALVSSQISGVSPVVQHRWDEYRLVKTAMQLAVDGRLCLTELITDTFPLADAAHAYQLLDTRRSDMLQVVLDFTDQGI